MATGFTPHTQVLSSAVAGTPVKILPLSFGLKEPGILCIVSSGASLTYSVEVTGDDVQAPGYNPATGNWIGFTSLTGLTASAVGVLGAVVTAIRPHITAYSSGTLTFQFTQIR